MQSFTLTEQQNKVQVRCYLNNGYELVADMVNSDQSNPKVKLHYRRKERGCNSYKYCLQ